LPSGTSKHSFPFLNCKYWFNLTFNSYPRITKTFRPQNVRIRLNILTDLPLLYIILPLPQINRFFLTIYIECLNLVCPSFTPEPSDQSQPNFVHTSKPTRWRFLTHVSLRQPYPWTPGYPKLQNSNVSQMRKLCVM